MEKIVIISDNMDQDSQLARVVRRLFSDCKVTIASRENGKIAENIKKGD